MATLAQEASQSKIHPHKLALWIAIGSMIMMFGALTSAYIVRRGQGNWLDFKLPDLFFLNTLVIVASSVTLHFSFQAFKNGKEKPYKLLMLATFGLGLLFLALQYLGWMEMTAIGATLQSNPGPAFVYVISGLHAAHLIGGLGALTAATIHAFYLPFKPTRRRQQRFELVVQFWHFVDVLWIYLLLFFVWQA
jgi:cytochrome c oxidase subunit III